MRRVIEYHYQSFLLGCECCSDSLSQYDVREDGEFVQEDVDCPFMESEEDLREYLSHLEPFEVDSASQWF